MARAPFSGTRLFLAQTHLSLLSWQTRFSDGGVALGSPAEESCVIKRIPHLQKNLCLKQQSFFSSIEEPSLDRRIIPRGKNLSATRDYLIDRRIFHRQKNRPLAKESLIGRRSFTRQVDHSFAEDSLSGRRTLPQQKKPFPMRKNQTSTPGSYLNRRIPLQRENLFLNGGIFHQQMNLSAAEESFLDNRIWEPFFFNKRILRWQKNLPPAIPSSTEESLFDIRVSLHQKNIPSVEGPFVNRIIFLRQKSLPSTASRS